MALSRLGLPIGLLLAVVSGGDASVAGAVAERAAAGKDEGNPAARSRLVLRPFDHAHPANICTPSTSLRPLVTGSTSCNRLADHTTAVPRSMS